MRPDLPHGDVDAPAAEDLFGDSKHPRPWEIVSELADAGLLTERQAEIYVRRAIENEPREAVAEHLGIKPSTLDDHYGRAKELLESAHRTLEAIDAYRAPTIPSGCSECGATLGHSWAEDDEGNAYCRDCAGVDFEV